MSDSRSIDPRLEQVLNFPLVSDQLGRHLERWHTELEAENVEGKAPHVAQP